MSLAGYCGDYCGRCDNHPSKCKGCLPQDHPECFFIKCCLQREIEHCGCCSDFPCQKLADFVPDDNAKLPVKYHIRDATLRRILGTKLWLKLKEMEGKSGGTDRDTAKS